MSMSNTAGTYTHAHTHNHFHQKCYTFRPANKRGKKGKEKKSRLTDTDTTKPPELKSFHQQNWSELICKTEVLLCGIVDQRKYLLQQICGGFQ